ncbi:gliding motility-associated C-terminal domain-containing protein [Fluviicola sp.]|uniref:gliding motility-associated C-terminal domain-containing protein n=1 Tax=Fluviicola sp. TaxID=1917219 RepID=UPI00261729A9|nr:gliding motility-associated C-terminal domain-containing protein [Fluviicola sp.]
MYFRAVKVLLISFLSAIEGFSQLPNDACATATPLCPNVTTSGSNIGATATTCPSCEDNFTFCFSGTNSVWYQFTTNVTGGTVNFNISNLLFNVQANRGTQLQAAIVQAIVPCDAATYTLVSNCGAGSATAFTLSAAALPANTTYYLVVNGAKNGGATLPAEATFDLVGFGPGFDRPPPAIAIGGPTTTICPQTPASFTTYLTNCTDTSDFYWSVNGVLRAVTQGSLWLTSELQNGDVVSVVCSCFDICPDTLTFSYPAVSVDPLIVDAGPDQTIQAGASVQLVGVSNGTDFMWNPTQTLNTPYSISTYATPDETTVYTLTAMNANCSLSDELTVFVSNNLNIPGSFSPNGDGHNDKWVIEGIDFYPDAQVVIYDRWGQKVAEIAGYSLTKAWDGTNKGKPVSDGVFFYSLDLRQNNDTKPLKGSITVIR